MYEIRIVKIRENKDAVYCGRGSILGNPFEIDRNHTREKVCSLYEVHFHKQVRNNPNFFNELKRLNEIGIKQGYLELGCFCVPKQCHVETIKHFLENNQDLFLDNT